MNENLKKALEIAKQGQQALKDYEPLVALTIYNYSSQVHLENEEFFANFTEFREEEGCSDMHLHTDYEGVDVVTLVSFKEWYKTREEKSTNEPETI